MAIGPIQTVAPVAPGSSTSKTEEAGVTPIVPNEANAPQTDVAAATRVEEKIAEELLAERASDAIMDAKNAGLEIDAVVDVSGSVQAEQSGGIENVDVVGAAIKNVSDNIDLGIDPMSPQNLAREEELVAKQGSDMLKSAEDLGAEAAKVMHEGDRNVDEARAALADTAELTEAGVDMIAEADALVSQAAEASERQAAEGAEAANETNFVTLRNEFAALAALDQEALQRAAEKNTLAQIRGQLTEEFVNTALNEMAGRLGSDVFFVPGDLVDDGARMLTDGVFLRPLPDEGPNMYELVAFAETKAGAFSAAGLAEGALVRNPRTGEVIESLEDRALRYASKSDSSELERVATDQMMRELGLVVGPDDAFSPQALQQFRDQIEAKLPPGETLGDDWLSTAILSQHADRMRELEAQTWDIGAGQIVKDFERLMTPDGQSMSDGANTVSLRLKEGALADQHADQEIEIRASRQSTLAIIAAPADVDLAAVRDRIGERADIRITDEIAPAGDLQGEGLAVAALNLDINVGEITAIARELARQKEEQET